MKQNKLLIRIFLIISIASALVACGNQGFDPVAINQDLTSEEAKYGDIELQTDETMQKVDALVVEIENDPTLLKVEQTSALSLLNIGKIKDLLKNGLKPLLGKIGDMKSKIGDLKSKLEQQIALLDPNDPQQKKLIDQLEKVLDRIAQFEGKIDDAIDMLLSKIDLLDKVFDKLLTKLDGSLWQLPAKFAIEELKDYLKDQLEGYLRGLIGNI